MKRNDYTEANRKAWNEAAPIHRGSQFADLLQDVREPDFDCLDDTLNGLLNGIGVRGKDVIQLICNNGRELLSIKAMGAARCVGVDIADEFVAQGRELVRASRLKCEMVQSDVYAVPKTYNGSFDLALITIGSLGWLPDVKGLMEVAYRLLRPGGRLLIYEMHPILDMFEGEDGQNPPPPLRYSYFQPDPFVGEDGLDYYEEQEYESSTSYWFPHPLSEIVQAAIDAGLVIEKLAEYAHDISLVYASFEGHEAQLPLCYSLQARRE